MNIYLKNNNKEKSIDIGQVYNIISLIKLILTSLLHSQLLLMRFFCIYIFAFEFVILLLLTGRYNDAIKNFMISSRICCCFCS